MFSALWSLPGLALVGLCVGSFVNVVVHRWPLMLERAWWWETARQLQDEESHRRVWARERDPRDDLQHQSMALAARLIERLEAQPAMSLSQPGSHCTACGHRLSWRELIPVVSWLWQRGRCTACGARIGLRLPVVELAVAALFLAMGWRWGNSPLALMWGGWAAALVALALIDWDTLLLPDGLTLPLVWAGLLAATMGWTIPPSQAVAGAVMGYGSLWLVATAFERLTGREGMGGGDFKLLAALGAWLGPLMLIPLVLMASVVGAAAGLWMKGRGGLRQGQFIPFGPFLAVAGLVVTLAGDERLARWMGWT